MTKSRGIIRKRKQWSAEEAALLKALYPCTRCEALATLFNCQKNQVYTMAKILGVAKSQWFKDSPMASRLRRGDNLGWEYRYKKGNIPANKGVKGLPVHPNSVATQFKKGRQPQNTMPIGAYRYDASNVLQRKVSNAKGSNSKRWRSVHELVWIEHNGPVPEKHFCVFKPGMWTNKLEEITIDRIDCIDLAENMRRNSFHRYGKEVAQLYQLSAQITRQINKRSNT